MTQSRIPSTAVTPRPALNASRGPGRAFSGNRITRISEGRTESSLSEALSDGESRFVLFREDRALLRSNGHNQGALFDKGAAETLGLIPESLILLGYEDGAPRLAGLVAENRLDTETETPADDQFQAIDGTPVETQDLRSLALQGLLNDQELGIVAQARATLSWHSNYSWCGKCGSRTHAEAGGVRRQCATCGAQHFPRVDPVAIMVAIDGDNCLLGRSPRFLPGMYSALAGFIEPGETIEEAVRRETLEESGIQLGDVTYIASQPWPFVSSLMIGCHAQAITRDIAFDQVELEDCRWFSRDEIKAMLSDQHGDNLRAPPEMAIANRLIRAFVSGEH